MMLVRSSPMKLPAKHDKAPINTANAGRIAAKLPDQYQEHRDRGRHQHQGQLMKRFLLLGIQAAVLQRNSGRQRKVPQALLDAGHRGAQIGSFDPGGNVDHRTQPLAIEFGALSAKSQRSHRRQRDRSAARGVNQRLSQRVEALMESVGVTDANSK